MLASATTAGAVSVLLLALVFGTWIWSPLYIDMEEVIVAAKQKSERMQEGARDWFTAKFGKEDKNPSKQNRKSVAQNEQVEDSMTTSIATKAKEKEQPDAGATGASSNLTMGQQQDHNSMLLARLKGANSSLLPAAYVHLPTLRRGATTVVHQRALPT